ncbi:MAG: protein kinase, partial [Deltaproteobacteria bacterium]|nr:protein kinase [Deltaproteobacteria bacterium]
MIGRTLAHYEIIGKLGQGGMGEVYRARDTKLDRDVAIKILPAFLARDPERLGRFKREAKAVAGLNHPHIVTLYSVERDGDHHFITMELVEGRTLSELIPKDGIPFDRLLDFGISMADAVASAHRNNITHRDLKPDNIMVNDEGRLKVLDFGLAKFQQEVQPFEQQNTMAAATRAMTGEGKILGTPAYMSPEQAEGKPVDHRTDIFSLGVIFYQMATGRQPFHGDTQMSTLTALLRDDPAPISEVTPSIPGELSQVVHRCLQKDPDRRFQTAVELRDDLQEIRDHLSASLLAPTPSVDLAQTIKRPLLAIPAVIVLLALAAVVVWQVQRGTKARWARHEAIPEIQRLVDATPGTGGPGMWQAYRLGQEAERYIADDPLLADLRERYSDPATIHTDPPGARVYSRPYGAVEEEWQLLGTTPIDKLDYVKGLIALRVEHEGYETAHDIHWSRVYESEGPGYVFSQAGSLPKGMVWVASSSPAVGTGAYTGLHMPGLEHLPKQDPGSFYMDRYEVTNREYKGFVDAGGYEDPKYWKEPFERNGVKISFEDAIAGFLDRTQRPGPANWEVGDYPDGEDKYPVTGISWYEAAAYAEFSGKSLPTIYHWNRVAFPWAISDIVPVSNLNTTGPMAVGSTHGENRFGAYDLAGNAREWCYNESSRGGRFILGGGWNDPAYAFVDAYAQSPWDRSATNGFRCIRYEGTDSDRTVLESEIELPFRDLLNEPAVSDETFAMYLNQFKYDAAPFNAVVEETLEEEDYVREKIAFDAAYGGERMAAYLFLPRSGTPPYQTVVYFPGSGSVHSRSSKSLTLQTAA